MNRFNVFFSSNNSVQTEVFRFSLTPTADFTPAPEGFAVTLASSSYTQHVGHYVIVAKSGLPSFYGIITHAISATQIYILPLISEGDTSTNIFQVYAASGSAPSITSDKQINTTLSIDLSDAPDGTYNYILAGSMSIAGTSTGNIIRPSLLSMCEPGDPFSNDGVQFNGRLHFTNGSYTASRETLEDTYCYNIVKRVSLTAGKTYEFHLVGEATSTSTGSAWLRNGSLMAFRVGSYQEVDGSTDTTGYSANAGSFVDGPSITVNSTDTYMIMWACSVDHTSTSSGGIQCRLNANGTIHSSVTMLPANTQDFISYGGWVTASLSATNVVKLQINNTLGATTSTITRYYLVAIPLASQTGYGFDYSNAGFISDSKIADTSSTATMKWNEGRTSTSVTMANRKYIEVISANARKDGGDRRCFARPVFRNGLSTGCAERGYVGPGLALQWGGFWFARTKPYLTDTTTNGIETKASVSDGNNVKLAYSWFMFLPEHDEYIPDETTETTIIADVESGLQFKSWNTQTTNVYKRQISEITQVSRVLRNSIELTQLTSKPANDGAWAAAATDTWYWDTTDEKNTIFIKTSFNPSNDDQTILVVALDTYSRTNEILYNTAGTLIPYESRLSKVPGLSQELEARGNLSQISSTIGSLVLPSSDREFDRKVTRRIYEGLRATIRRGYSSLSSNLDSFYTLAKGIMALPKLDDGKFEIKLYDTGVILNKALDDQTISVYRGTVQTEGQALPIIYGTVKRVPAYRITDVDATGTNRNTYKICSHYLKSIDACYLDGTTSLTAGTSGTGGTTIGTTYPASAAFLGPSHNNGTDNAGWNADVLYVDVTGHTVDNVYTSTLLERPGEIMKHILQNYPRVKTDISTGFASADVSNSFTQTAAVFNIDVSSNSSFSIGDVVKIKQSTNQFHAYIYAKPSNQISVATLYRTGDTPTGTGYNTTADVFLVEKSGGLSETQLNHESFRLLDRKWRKKLSSGLLIKRHTPLIGAILTGTESIANSLNKIGGYTFSYWYVNRSGRICVGVPDFDASNLLENPGFESFSSIGVWPYKSINNIDQRSSMGNVTLTSTKKYEGLNCAKFENKNGSIEAVPNARGTVTVVLPTPGLYAVTALAALESGNGNAFRIGINSPGDSRDVTVSNPVQLASDEWRRVTTYIDTGRGNSGTAFLRFYHYNPTLVTTAPTFTGPTLIYWFKADEPKSTFDLPRDNEILTAWHNKGTLGSSFAASGTPRFIKDYVQGRPGIALDSVSDTFSMVSPTGATSQYTMFVVYALNDTYSGARRVAIAGSGSGSDEFFIGTKSSVTNYTVEGTDGGVGETLTGETTSSNVNTLKIHTYRISGTASQYYINGTLQGSAGTKLPAWDLLLSIGSGTYPLNGVVCEFLIYNKALGAANRRSVENYLAEKYGIDGVGAYVDNIEVSRIAGVIDDVTADSLPLEFRDEIYPEAKLTYNVNNQDTNFASSVIISDAYAKNLSSTVSEGKNAIQTSMRLDTGTPILVDSASAAGIGAALVAYFGRLRYFVKLTMFANYDSIPDVGMKLLNWNTTRLPQPNDEYPLFPITMVDYNEDNARQLEIAIESQIDPVLDRGNIVQDSLPLGTILPTLDTGTLSYVTSNQFKELTEGYDRYLMGAAETDLVTEHGDLYHTHDLSHTHNISNHRHSVSITSIGTEVVTYYDINAQKFFGTDQVVARGIDSGSHTHIGSASGNSEYFTGNSGQSTTSLTSVQGPNDPSYIRVRLVRHNNDAPSGTPLNLPTTVNFMYESNSVPNGWTRNTSFNGYYLRCATANGVIFGRTIASSFTMSDSGFTITFTNFSDVQDMQRGKRLIIVNTTSGTKTWHVIVSSIDETNKQITVYPLHEDGDTANTASVGPSNTTVSADPETAGQTFTNVNHDHADTVSSHTHTATHTHDVTSLSLVSDPPSDTVNIIQGSLSNAVAGPTHTHSITDFDLPSSPGTSPNSASGSTFQNITSQPDGYGLIFMTSPASNRIVPAGAIIFFDGNACPVGYTRYGNADNLLIFGTSGNTAEARTGGHTHTFTAASHSLSHNHGGSTTTLTIPLHDLYEARSCNLDTLGGTFDVSPFEHLHDVNIVVGSDSSSLESKTVTSGSSNVKNPLHKKILLCKKD